MPFFLCERPPKRMVMTEETVVESMFMIKQPCMETTTELQNFQMNRRRQLLCPCIKVNVVKMSVIIIEG